MHDQINTDMTADNEQLRLSEQLQVFGHGLQRLAQEQIGIRQQIEDRWLADLEQYMGRYDANTLERLKKTNGSQTFVNITRAKTTAAESRISDMLFPSDDKNWGIQPTPVPELARVEADRSIGAKSDIAKALIEDAKKRAEAMTREIDDQLVEAGYHQVARDVIHDACLFGTGILKGPIVINRTRKSWEKVSGAVHVLNMVNEYRPGCERVKVWDFFPDMSASTLDECGFVFERRYLTKKQLIGLAKRPGYLIDQIRQVIAETPKQISSAGGTHISRMREMSSLNVNLDDNRYEVWEYHGPALKEDLIACGCEVNDDELAEFDVIVTFINGRVIKADLNPLETGENPYSVFCYEDDDTSVFGIGIPHLMQNEQKIVNAAWRMTLDNAALSTGPQIVVNREMVIPADGSWDLKAKKVWWLTDPDRRVDDVFETHEISSHQDELTQIFEMAKNMADDVTSLPMLAQGEKGDAPDTATGMSMLMNNSNVVLRKVIKAFDDGITKPFVTRMYDWNMQYSEKEEIKGDFEIDARGSSALLVKETQTQALHNLLQIVTNPVYAGITKVPDLLRKAVEAQHISADEIIKTEQEIQSESSTENPEAAQQRKLMDLQIKELEARIDKLNSEATVKNIEGLYSSMQAAGVAATDPRIIPIADSIAKSSGFVDKNGSPIAEAHDVIRPGPVPVSNNTDPRFPANPDSPLTGVRQGIETQRIDG
jgi:hypothetical protein